MESINIKFVTDGSGNFTVTIPRSEYTLAPIQYLIYQIEIDGTNLTGGTLLLKQTTNIGIDENILSLSAANVVKIFRPRTIEHDNLGANLSTNTLIALRGDVTLILAGCGANKAGIVSIMPI